MKDFFADVAVLVEGEDDVASILACATVLGYDFSSMGISVISCNGKSSIDRPALIFKSLGIPTYIVWDGDKGSTDAKSSENHTMLRLVDESVEDFPQTQVKQNFACFEINLETTIKNEIGSSEFDNLLELSQSLFGFPRKNQALKNPFIISDVLSKAKANGHISASLEEIVNQIVKLKK